MGRPNKEVAFLAHFRESGLNFFWRILIHQVIRKNLRD